MVPGYRHLPGSHCGSTALRNLLAHHGAEISEEMALGLGAGVSFYYLHLDGQSPSRFLNGRTRSLEEQFVELTGAPIRLETFDRPEDSWEAARETVDEGRSAILLTDLYHLDHYGTSARFPGHAVVLAGYDRERAYLSDTAFSELQVTRLENLARARHGDHPALALAGHMFTVSGPLDVTALRSAITRAIDRDVRQMIDPPLGEYEGLPALRRFASEVGEWPSELEDWRWCARFGYQVIERRGTGGGNFRLMYSRFLEEVASEQAPLAAEAASNWTALAEALEAASQPERPDRGRWARVSERAARVLDAEERLWPALAS
jgi:Butirosin biosynthesis protein H, N-terminal/Domain of unknown function (DUF4872)